MLSTLQQHWLTIMFAGVSLVCFLPLHILVYIVTTGNLQLSAWMSRAARNISFETVVLGRGPNLEAGIDC